MSANESLVFLSGKRTPFGANGGSLREINPTDLALCAAKACIEQSGVSADQVDHTVVGNVLYSAGDSIYTPRHVGLRAGVPLDRPALGINRLCGSGFQVIVEAWHQMLAGDTNAALVGGVENMSMAPYVVRGARFGMKMGHTKLEDMLLTGLHDSGPNLPMAMTAENLGAKYQVTREEADELALRSQQNTKAA